MTDSGEHGTATFTWFRCLIATCWPSALAPVSGGASREETDSGLFVFRTEPFYEEDKVASSGAADFPVWNDHALRMELSWVEDVLRRPRTIMQVSTINVSFSNHCSWHSSIYRSIWCQLFPWWWACPFRSAHSVQSFRKWCAAPHGQATRRRMNSCCCIHYTWMHFRCDDIICSAAVVLYISNSEISRRCLDIWLIIRAVKAPIDTSFGPTRKRLLAPLRWDEEASVPRTSRGPSSRLLEPRAGAWVRGRHLTPQASPQRPQRVRQLRHGFRGTIWTSCQINAWRLFAVMLVLWTEIAPSMMRSATITSFWKPLRIWAGKMCYRIFWARRFIGAANYRRQWTQFNVSLMIIGIAAFGAVAALSVYKRCVDPIKDSSPLLIAIITSIIIPTMEVWCRLAARWSKLSQSHISFKFITIYYMLTLISSTFHALSVLSNSFIAEVCQELLWRAQNVMCAFI